MFGDSGAVFGAATDSMRMALSTAFEPGLLKRARSFSFRGCVRRMTRSNRAEFAPQLMISREAG
jgi:hypothetical protein